MKTHRFRLAAALTAAMIVLTALTGCMTGPRKPSSPAESAVTVDGEIRGLFIHATGQDLIIQSPYDAGTVSQSLDQIMSYAAENGINTVFMDVHDAKGSALYTSDYMPTSELMLDEKGKNSGGDIVYEAVRAAKKQNIQVYAVINTTYIAESLGIASEDHPAVYDSSLSYEDGNGALRWNTSKKDSMSSLTNIARELCYNYGISGLVLNDDGTDPQTMAKVFSAIDQAVDELGTGKKIGVYTQITPQGLESGNNALNAFSEEGYAPDFLLADLQGTTVSGDYTQLLNDVSAATEGRCDLITVHNMNLISADSGADGKLYADKLSEYKYVHSWAGHSHLNFNKVYAKTSENRLPNVEGHIVARATGALWLNEWVCSDGTPRGYYIVDVDGEEIEWYYHPCGNQLGVSNGFDDYYQIRAYRPGDYEDGYVYANVWGWDALWGNVLYTDNGEGSVEKRPMARYVTYDKAYKDCCDLSNSKPGNIAKEEFEPDMGVQHIFRIVPSEGATSCTIEVTDRFGRSYSTSLDWGR